MSEDRRSGNSSQNAPMHAQATTVVHQYEPIVYDKPREGPALARIHLGESFHGDIEGNGIADCVQSANLDGSSRLVAIEKVAGALAGRRGAFVLQVAATVTNKRMSAEWFVIPRSGKGQLAGLRGQGGFRTSLGESGQGTLEYWFE